MTRAILILLFALGVTLIICGLAGCTGEITASSAEACRTACFPMAVNELSSSSALDQKGLCVCSEHRFADGGVR